MIDTLELARKYAQAFMDIDGESILEQDYENIVVAKDGIEKHMLALHILSAPTITKKEQAVCIKKLIEQYSLPHSFISLVQLLCNHGRAVLFVHVLAAIAHLYLEKNNSIKVIIHTSSKITDSMRNTIITFIETQTKKRVLATSVITPSLIAGIRIESDQFVWDYSVQKQLRRATSL